MKTINTSPISVVLNNGIESSYSSYINVYLHAYMHIQYTVINIYVCCFFHAAKLGP